MIELSKINRMNSGNNLNPEKMPQPLQTLAGELRAIAQSAQGDCLALLAILRTLEALHQEIRDNLFQDALPDNRQALYALLKDIESESGWPYIPRMKLQSFLNQWVGEGETTKSPMNPLEMSATSDERSLSTHNPNHSSFFTSTPDAPDEMK